MSPAEENRNIPWLSLNHWQSCRSAFGEEDLQGEPCWAGIEQANYRGASALVLLFPTDRDRYRLLPRFWLPENTAREYGQQVPFLKWAEQGLITLTDGDVCDFTAMRAALNEVHELYDLQGLLFDPYNSSHLVNELIEDDGWDPETMIEFPQAINNFAEPAAEFERRVLNGTLQHPGHAVLSWMVRNTTARIDSIGQRLPFRPWPQRIHHTAGVAAAIMALAGALPDEKRLSHVAC